MDQRPDQPVPPGHDTPTGTDPHARYTGPGYEDVSFGQAVDRDAELAEQIAEESDSEAEAERRFEEEAVGAPAIRRQHDEHAQDRGPGGDPSAT